MARGLVERRVELGQISDAVGIASGGEGAVLLIEGSIGVGKSALLNAVRDAGGRAGLRVLTARGGEVERGLGWGVARDLLVPAVSDLDTVKRERLFSGAAARAGAVLGIAGMRQALPPEGSLATAIHALYWLLVGMTATGGVVLAVDDVHWSDDASLRWLAYVAPRLEGLPVLLALAIRDGDEGAAAARDALIGSSAPEFVLRPRALSAEGAAELTRELVRRRAEPEFVDACFEATAGNPLLLTQLARALKAEGLDPSRATAATLSRFDLSDVARSVLVRISRLAPEASQVAAGASVLGTGARLGDISRLLELDEPSSLAAADALVTAGIFSSGTPIEFVHPIVRDAVYEDIPPHLRSELHLRASRELERTGRSEASATQLLSVAPGDDPAIAEALEAGAEAAMERGAAGSAVLYLRRALEEGGDRPTTARLHHRLGTAAVRAGYFEEGFAALYRAAETETDVWRRAAVAVELGSRLAVIGTGQATPFLKRMVAELADHREAAAMVEGVYLAIALMWAEEAEAAVARLRELYGRRGEHTNSPLLLAALATATIGAGDEPVETLIELAERAHREGVIEFQPMQHVTYVGSALVRAEAFEAAEKFCDEAMRHAQDRGGPLASAFVLWCRSGLNLRRGDIAGAEADARSAIDQLGQHGILQTWMLALLAEPLVERDRATEALELLDQAPAVPEAVKSNWPVFEYRAVRAHVLHALGNPAAAADELDACNATYFAASPACLRSKAAAALVHHALGHSELAEDLAAENLKAARRFGAMGTTGIALRSMGVVTEGEAGLQHLRESEAMLAQSGLRLEHARTELELGAALRRAGRRADARKALGRAYASARACGGLRVARLAAEELRVAGARPRRDELHGRDVLTASELRVARLAADGRSNAQIAQELYVTLRTVETHLTHAYQKLDINRRAELPKALETTVPTADKSAA